MFSVSDWYSLRQCLLHCNVHTNSRGSSWNAGSDSVGWGGPWDSAFLRNSQVISMPLVQGPHFEDKGSELSLDHSKYLISQSVSWCTKEFLPSSVNQGSFQKRKSGHTGVVRPDAPRIPERACEWKCQRCTGNRGRCTGRFPAQRQPLEGRTGWGWGDWWLSFPRDALVY